MAPACRRTRSRGHLLVSGPGSFALSSGQAVLLAGGPYSQPEGSHPYAAHFCALFGTSQPDPLYPAPGEALYYLVTGRGAMGEEPLGHGDTERPNVNPCP